MSDHLKRLRECAQYGDTPGVLKKDLRALIADYDEAVRVLRALYSVTSPWAGQPGSPHDEARKAADAVLVKAGGK